MIRRSIPLLAPLIASLAISSSRAQEAPAAERPGPPSAPSDRGIETSASLLEAGDALARSGRYEEALDSWKRAFERRLAGYREVAFAYPVTAEHCGRTELRAKLTEEFAKEMPDEKIEAMKTALAAFGFFGPELDLKETFIGLLTEEVAGFYDPDTKKLYLIREGGPGTEDKRRWWEKLLNKGGFDPDEAKIVLIHEMSHALVDQHHDLLSIQRSVEADDDMELAASALIEGDATLCMFIGASGEGKKSLLEAPPEFMNLYFNMITPFLSFASGPAYRKAPRLVRESLLFPYLSGLTFCMSLTSAEGSWKRVDRAFSEPPLSTEQILHPGKYPGDSPVALSFPDLEDDLGPGLRSVYSNVLGEFQIRILLSEKLAGRESERAAEGWGGDLYRIYETSKTGSGESGGRGEILLAWASAWDSETDAGEFREAFARFLSARLGKEPEDEIPLPDASGFSWTRSWWSGGKVTAVFSRGRDVWFLQDIPEKEFPKVAARVQDLRRSPKEFHLKKVKPSGEFPEEKRLRGSRI